MPSGQKPPVSPFAHEVNAIIRGHLARIGWTHGDLAHRIDISTSQMSRILRGDRHLDVDQLEQICHVLGLDPADIIGEAWRVARTMDDRIAAEAADMQQRLSEPDVSEQAK